MKIGLTLSRLYDTMASTHNYRVRMGTGDDVLGLGGHHSVRRMGGEEEVISLANHSTRKENDLLSTVERFRQMRPTPRDGGAGPLSDRQMQEVYYLTKWVFLIRIFNQNTI